MFDRNKIREGMEVFGSCGNRLGTVDRVEGRSLKLRKNDPRAGGQHHFIPFAWVQRVDRQVHLNRDCGEVREAWQAEPVGAGA